jgi:hypothetical protein
MDSAIDSHIEKKSVEKQNMLKTRRVRDLTNNPEQLFKLSSVGAVQWKDETS